MTDKNVREELAELTEAVRELRENEVADEIRALRAEVEKLRAERNAHSCHGHSCCHHCNWGHCGCFIFHSYAPTWNPTWTATSGDGSVTIGGGSGGSAWGDSFTVASDGTRYLGN